MGKLLLGINGRALVIHLLLRDGDKSAVKSCGSQAVLACLHSSSLFLRCMQLSVKTYEFLPGTKISMKKDCY